MSDNTFPYRGPYRGGSWVSDGCLIVWRSRSLDDSASAQWPQRRALVWRELRELLEQKPDNYPEWPSMPLKDARKEIREERKKRRGERVRLVDGKFVKRTVMMFDSIRVDTRLLLTALEELSGDILRFRGANSDDRLCIDLVAGDTRARVMGLY